MSIDLSQFHEAFFEEALLSLDQAEDDLLLFEKGTATHTNIDSAFRAIHSIKGSAGSLGFVQMCELAHEFESVLDDLRSNAADTDYAANDEQVSVLLSALDLLRSQIGNAQRKNGDVAQSRVSALIEKLKSYHELSNVNDQIGNIEEPTEEPRVKQLLDLFRIRFAPKPEMLACGNEPIRYIDSLLAMGSATVNAYWNEIPDNKDSSNCCQLSWVIFLETTKSQSEVAELFSWVDDVCFVSIEPIAEKTLLDQTTTIDLVPRRRETDIVEKAESTAPRSTRSIQVQSEKIDALLSQLGELAIAQSDIENRIIDRELADLFQRLTRQTGQLQDAILAMRMAPIKILFRRFERVVRDAELELEKKVHLIIEGDENQLDSSIIERLIDPITHLIRNALDHGIEHPAKRIASGKNSYAQLKLIAEQKASAFVIRIEDDGNGLAIESIRQKAIEKGLATSNEVKTAAQWAQMIFKAGFSTAASVSQWSGRGVGLDAVAEALKQLNARIDIHTTPGQGTSIAIVLPLTLAISDALIVEADGQTYAIPMASVTECLHSTFDAIATLPNQQMLFRLRKALLPFASLSILMNDKEQLDTFEQFSCVAITNGKDEAVLKVSRIVGQRQIVIKSISNNLGSLGLAKYCSSATLLEDSKVVFVLDSTQIIRQIGQLETFEA